jgi:hypothetical protein
MLWKRIWVIIFGIGLSIWIGQGARAAPLAAPCLKPGWFPTTFGLKDHSVFWYSGFYYLISTHVSSEDRFAYGRSSDLCTWEKLAPVLPHRTPGAWDEMAIWAPFVYKENGVYYLFYTGVTHAIAQSIMLATSNNPADPASWQTQGMIFQPTHPDMVWGGFNTWSDCRDPTMLKIGSIYYLYYTGLDQAGGIVGVATASSPLGPWTDWGAILTLTNGMAESSTLAAHGGSYYLFYHDTSQSERFRIGPGPTGPWTEAYGFTPGWAHEIWQGQDGYEYTSFLTDYSVTISHLIWDTFYNPPLPFIGENVYHLMLPLIVH